MINKSKSTPPKREITQFKSGCLSMTKSQSSDCVTIKPSHMSHGHFVYLEKQKWHPTSQLQPYRACSIVISHDFKRSSGLLVSPADHPGSKCHCYDERKTEISNTLQHVNQSLFCRSPLPGQVTL